jgi:hypothetical protein
VTATDERAAHRSTDCQITAEVVRVTSTHAVQLSAGALLNNKLLNHSADMCASPRADSERPFNLAKQGQVATVLHVHVSANRARLDPSVPQ